MKQQGITDFHTHAFPDAIADRAMEKLREGCSIVPHLDGRISSLLKSMDAAGITRSVICSIATKPSQFEPIMAWSKQIRSERIVPLLSIHPDDPLAAQHIARTKSEGFCGIKMHPYYQEFSLDEERLMPIYEKLCSENLLLLMHTGFDISFEYNRIADPQKIVSVMEKFPKLKLVTSHLGAWSDWQEVQKRLIGRNIYVEISMSLEYLDDATIRNMILSHPADYILFGTDSPWCGQQEYVNRVRNLGLGAEVESKLFHLNAVALLG